MFVILKTGMQCIHVYALLLFPKVKHTSVSSPPPPQILLSYFAHCSLHPCIKVLMDLDCEPSNIGVSREISDLPSTQNMFLFSQNCHES